MTTRQDISTIFLKKSTIFHIQNHLRDATRTVTTTVTNIVQSFFLFQKCSKFLKTLRPLNRSLTLLLIVAVPYLIALLIIVILGLLSPAKSLENSTITPTDNTLSETPEDVWDVTSPTEDTTTTQTTRWSTTTRTTYTRPSYTPSTEDNPFTWPTFWTSPCRDCKESSTEPPWVNDFSSSWAPPTVPPDRTGGFPFLSDIYFIFQLHCRVLLHRLFHKRIPIFQLLDRRTIHIVRRQNIKFLLRQQNTRTLIQHIDHFVQLLSRKLLKRHALIARHLQKSTQIPNIPTIPTIPNIPLLHSSKRLQQNIPILQPLDLLVRVGRLPQNILELPKQLQLK